MQTLRAVGLTKLRDEVILTDKRTGAETRYMELALRHPTQYTPFDFVRTKYGAGDSRSIVGF